MKNKCIITTADPYNDLGFLIWQIMKVWQREKLRIIDEFGITGSQLEVLSTIYHLSQKEQKISQITISTLTNVDPMTTSTILRNLEKKQYVTRKSSETDTRARIVEITDAGEELFLKAITKVKESNELLMKDIDGDALKEQLRILLNVLNNQNN